MKKILKVLFILIGLGLIGTSIFMYTNKTEKEEPKKEEAEKEEPKKEVEKKEIEIPNNKFVDITNASKISFNGKTYTLTTGSTIYLDDKDLVSTSSPYSVGELFEYEDKLLIVVYGTDARKTKIVVFDLNRNYVVNIYYLDDDGEMVITNKDDGKLDYVLHDDYIEFGGTRLTEDHAYAKNGENICTGTVDGSIVATARYKMNSKFEFEVISGTEKTIDDLKKEVC